jgi:hypothetical protein
MISADQNLSFSIDIQMVHALSFFRSALTDICAIAKAFFPLDNNSKIKECSPQARYRLPCQYQRKTISPTCSHLFAKNSQKYTSISSTNNLSSA